MKLYIMYNKNNIYKTYKAIFQNNKYIGNEAMKQILFLALFLQEYFVY